MNTLNTNPIPYYNHFLFKESIDLKNSLIQSAKEYKLVSGKMKEVLKKMNRLDHLDLEENNKSRLKELQTRLENAFRDLRSQDDLLFDLQKSLQSNKVYDESFQKSIRISCKENLKKMDYYLEHGIRTLNKAELFLEENGMVSSSENILAKTNLDWIFSLPSLLSPAKRIVR